MKRSIKNMSEVQVNKSKCKTCPFNKNGCPEIRERLKLGCITTASQLCHGTKDKTLCRGARDYQQMIFYRLGVIEAPTDEAWEEAWLTLKKRQ